MILLISFICALALAAGLAVYHVSATQPSRPNTLRRLAGPPIRKLFGSHMDAVLDPSKSPKIHAHLVEKYGRHVRVRGVGPWDERLLPLDPVSAFHVLKNTTIYEKPWQSRRLITDLIGCGRVATPAFSIQNLRALVPIVFRKGNELRDKWLELLDKSFVPNGERSTEVDVCHWISRATFDVIGLAGFDYHFNAIQNESDELFCAYKEMFEIALAQRDGHRTILGIYLPIINVLFPDERVKTIKRCCAVINRVAGSLLQSKKARIMEGDTGKDLISLLRGEIKLGDRTLPPDQRISDEDILHNINTFMFAGSDTSSLALTWTLLLLAKHPDIQSRLRAELFGIVPSTPLSRLTDEEIESLYIALSDHDFLNNVVRESLRLVPPVHSSLRVAAQDDVMPTSYPVHLRNGRILDQKSIYIRKGDLIHVPVEAFNLDKDIWGENAWEFDPDRWDHLPEAVEALPGLYSNLLTFSAGPRSCIGMRFSMIEIKTFLYILLTTFSFAETNHEIYKANVVLTRPYISGQFEKGSQCPLLVTKVGG
ncbi:cytochrome P450 [Chiua virens]|nr:cytochrome P450 [Chiua virens]